MPQLNPEFFITQLFWLVVTFSFLYIFLWRISLPRISSTLKKRKKKIDEDLATAKELHEKAQNIQDIIDHELKKSRLDTAELIKSKIIDLQKISINEITKIDEEMDKKINAFSKVVEKNKKESFAQIQHQIFEITKLTLSKIGNFKVNDDEINEAINLSGRNLN
mgnify:CR=1 FL=1